MKSDMNPVVISAFIALAGFILTILSALYLNQRHVDKPVEQIERSGEVRRAPEKALMYCHWSFVICFPGGGTPRILLTE
jgi:hypothetical protein